MEELAGRIKRVRKKEVKLLERVIERKGMIFKALNFDKLRNLSEGIFWGYIRKEGIFLLALVKNAVDSKTEVEKINQMLKTENNLELAYLTLSGMLWLVPVVGTLLFLVSSSLLTWLNTYSKNYKNLEKMLR